MKEIIDLLHRGGYSCVIRNDGEIRTFTQRGVADLYTLLQQKSVFLEGASIADKVVGKGAASLMILGGIRQIYADVMSQSAYELLQRTGVKTDFGLLVPFIENRDKSGWCPVEKLCFPAETAEDALPLIEGFIKSLKK